MNRWNNSTVDTYKKHFGVASKPVVYEVGSRDGNDGVELANRISDKNIEWSNIVLFECNPPQQQVIKQSYPQATLVKEAISDKKGQVEFLQIHGDKNLIGSSSMNLNRAKEPWVKTTSTITVQTRRLDDVIKELGHQKTEIDVCKIDIEHYSYQALVSMGKYLRNVRVFHIETEIDGLARAETHMDVALLMLKNGYYCSAIEHEWGLQILDQVWYRA